MSKREKGGVSSSDVRRIALALPEAVEQDHHGFSSFRVRGKIFATLRDPAHVHVMLAADAAETVAQHESGACEELSWGKPVAGRSAGRGGGIAVLGPRRAQLGLEAAQLDVEAHEPGAAVGARRSSGKALALALEKAAVLGEVGSIAGRHREGVAMHVTHHRGIATITRAPPGPEAREPGTDPHERATRSRPGAPSRPRVPGRTAGRARP